METAAPSPAFDAGLALIPNEPDQPLRLTDFKTCHPERSETAAKPPSRAVEGPLARRHQNRPREEFPPQLGGPSHGQMANL